MTRNERILKSIELNKGVGLELGPLTAPIIKKQDAKKVYYLDHLSTEDLKKKYKDEPVVAEDIVEVDFVLGNKKLKDVVGGVTFDYVVASHVIEHIEDIVSWMNDIADILNTGGVLSLAIPDKRFTFDITRDVSRPADVIGAYLDRFNRPSSAMVYDYVQEYVPDVDTAKAWAKPHSYDSKVKRWSTKDAYEQTLKNLAGGFVDTHCYVFTPASFIAVLRDIIAIQLIPFELDYFLETQQNELEFYVTLKKVDIKKVDINAALRNLPKIKDEDPWVTIETLRKQISLLESDINNLTASTSWRVTSPLRKASELKKDLRRKKH